MFRKSEKVFLLAIILARIRTTNQQGCGGTLPGLTGDLTHENYPENYQSDMNCQWDTIAREPDKVFFDFELLDIEADNNGACSYDFVSIKFSDDSDATKFCGREERRDADEILHKNGTGNPIIKFVSDDSVEYTGFLAKYRIERYDYCLSQPCENNSTCELDDSKEEGWFCDCQSGWTGQVCGEDLDECEEVPCENDGECTTPEFDMYECECLEGFTGENCETNIDECESDPCQHGGSCVDEVNSYKCECSGGFTGEHCGEELNECESEPCQNGGTCEDKMDGYNCVCIRGYRGENCEIDIDDCEGSPCENEGTCNDEVDGYSCVCKDGFTGSNCQEEINECSSEPCQNGGTCVNDIDSYKCACVEGFTSQQCEIDLDECDSNPCHNSGHCVDHPSMYECICEPGFGGVNCDEDACDPSPCLNGGTCEYGPGGYNCVCTPDFEGVHCDGEASACASQPCLNEGLCSVERDSYSCLCKSGYQGNNCETLITSCNPDPCLNEGLCRENGATYRCECKHGFTGTHCETDEESAQHERAHLLSALLPSLLFCLVLLILALLFFLYIQKKRKNETQVKVIKVKPSNHKSQFVKKLKKDEPKPTKKKLRHKKKHGSHKKPESDSVTEVENEYIRPSFDKRPSAFVGNMSIPGVPMFYNKSNLDQPGSYHNNSYYDDNIISPQMKYSYNNAAFDQSNYGYKKHGYDSELWATQSKRSQQKPNQHKYRNNIDQSDLSSYSNKYDTSTDEYQQNQSNDAHWQDRDNKKLNNCPTKHIFYVPDGPPRLESKLEHKRSPDQPAQPTYTDKLSFDNRERIHRFQREKTQAHLHDNKPKHNNTNSSILLNNQRKQDGRKLQARKISFDPRVQSLSPITEHQVRYERYPPEGGIDTEMEPEIKHKSSPSKQEIPKVSPFKCIRKNNPLNINRGRGFTRENAFIQKV